MAISGFALQRIQEDQRVMRQEATEWLFQNVPVVAAEHFTGKQPPLYSCFVNSRPGDGVIDAYLRHVGATSLLVVCHTARRSPAKIAHPGIRFVSPTELMRHTVEFLHYKVVLFVDRLPAYTSKSHKALKKFVAGKQVIIRSHSQHDRVYECKQLFQYARGLK